MSDHLPQIHETLSTLREQLFEADEISPALRTSLLETVDDLEDSLNTSEGETPRHIVTPRGAHSLQERLVEATLEFEESHPAVAKTLHNLVDALARIGI
jgi:hypothetical protein